jgi:polysaccharide export outer membrane protein
MERRRALPWAPTAALLVTGCAQVAPGLPPPPGPPPVAASGPPQGQPPPYHVQVGDVLSIRFLLEPELNEDVTVRPDGRISTQLARSVLVLGRTTDQVADALRAPYSAELRQPDIGVEVKSYAPARVYVAGEVVSAGEFSVPAGANLTLAQAVARAGGLRTSGDPDHVLLLRRGDADRPVVYAVDYRAVMRGRDAAADVPLAPYDVVYVPKTGISAAYVWFNQHIQQFVPVSWGFSYNVNPLVK